jgi:hypothetical protein
LDSLVEFSPPGTQIPPSSANFDLWGVAEKRKKKRKKERKKRKKKEGFSTLSWVSKLYPFWVFLWG